LTSPSLSSFLLLPPPPFFFNPYIVVYPFINSCNHLLLRSLLLAFRPVLTIESQRELNLSKRSFESCESSSESIMRTRAEWCLLSDVESLSRVESREDERVRGKERDSRGVVWSRSRSRRRANTRRGCIEIPFSLSAFARLARLGHANERKGELTSSQTLSLENPSSLLAASDPCTITPSSSKATTRTRSVCNRDISLISALYLNHLRIKDHILSHCCRFSAPPPLLRLRSFASVSYRSVYSLSRSLAPQCNASQLLVCTESFPRLKLLQFPCYGRGLDSGVLTCRFSRIPCRSVEITSDVRKRNLEWSIIL